MVSAFPSGMLYFNIIFPTNFNIISKCQHYYQQVVFRSQTQTIGRILYIRLIISGSLSAAALRNDTRVAKAPGGLTCWKTCPGCVCRKVREMGSFLA